VLRLARRPLLRTAAVLSLLLLSRAEAAPPAAAADAAPPAASGPTCLGESCQAVARGFVAFFDRTPHGLGGNGRSCGDCHMVTDHFQLSPAQAEARFQALQARRARRPSADDPLFRPIDADDFRTNGAAASDYSNLRENGLVRVTFPLPPAIKLIDPATGAASGETSVDVWRMVPSVDDVRLTGASGANPWFRDPNRTGGYQLDARVGTLQEQAAGAFAAHAQTQGTPSPRLLDDLAAFQRVLFSSAGVRRMAEAMRRGAPVPDPDPPLTETEAQGKAVFARSCAQCHGGLTTTNSPLGIVRFHDIASQCPRPVDAAPTARFVFKPCPPRLMRNVRQYEVKAWTGATLRLRSSDPGRALLTGYVGGPPPQDDWNKFDVPNLHGIARTAPYFHNNSADTLEEVLDHYDAFFKRVPTNVAPGLPLPPVISSDGKTIDLPFTPEERDALLAYLKKL
jgi:cytochrome c peroxidase